MLAKMIDKIVSLKETKIFEIDGQTYTDTSLTRIPPHVDRPDCISVSGLDSICKLSRMTNENSVSTNDNGVTQTVEARQGVALNALVEIKPRVMLRPFRTFLEVEQPESEFLLRVDPDEGIGFFEADGGIWKLEAKKNIADYFLKNMGDLIDAGKVVVMQ